MMTRQRVWLTGAGGQLGTALRTLFPAPESFEWMPTWRTDVDLTDLASVRNYIRLHQPPIVVNAAAYTAVDGAETDADRARILNVELPRVLAEELIKYGGTLVHVSTDYVFGGAEGRYMPYTETDDTAPLSVYGQTKAEGEETVAMIARRYYILRTSWLYGPTMWGRSFYRAIRERVLRGDALRVVTDEVGSPTSSLTLARVIKTVVESALSGTAPLPYGLYHVADLGETSRYHFAEVIASLAVGQPYAVEPTTHAGLMSIAHRPEYSALSIERIREYYPELFCPWESALAEVVAMEQR